MIERIDCVINVYGNVLEIIPKNKQIENNSSYEIRIEKLSNKNNTKILENFKRSFYTKFTPCYCSIIGVRSIINIVDVDNLTILYHIREASKYANWIKPALKDISESEIPFEVEQFVKFKAAYDCLLSVYVDKASGNGGKGQLGDVAYGIEPKFSDISKLLKQLEALVEEWRYAVRGYVLEGRTPPKSTYRGKNAVPSSSNAPKDALIRPIGLDYSRGV